MKIKPLLIVTFIAAILLFLAVRGCHKNSQDLKAVSEVLDLERQEFKEFRTESGLRAAEANQQIMSLEALLVAKKREVARLTKELGLKPKKITEVVEIEVSGKDSIVMKIDTAWYPSSPEEPQQPAPYVYEDKWNSFQAFQTGDQIQLLYAITDSISIVTTKERDGFKVQALSSNPAIRITGLSQVVVGEERKKKRWWIVPASIAAGLLIGTKVF